MKRPTSSTYGKKPGHGPESVSEDVASLAAPLMQKHNIHREEAAKFMERERKSDQKEMIIRKNMGRLQKIGGGRV